MYKIKNVDLSYLALKGIIMLRQFVIAVMLIVSVASWSTLANAAVGDTKPIPRHNGASGSIKLVSARVTTRISVLFKAKITVNKGSNEKCVYAQYRALGSWLDVKGSLVCRGSDTINFEQGLPSSYDGLTVRICQKNRIFDTCGDPVTVKR